MGVYMYMHAICMWLLLVRLCMNLNLNLNFVYIELHELPARIHSPHQTFLHITLSPPASYSSVRFPFCEICRPAACRPARSWGWHLGSPMSLSYSKFVFPSHYLPLPILDVSSLVVNSSSHLITCHFPSWKWHVMW